jgi:hypothetical protein
MQGLEIKINRLTSLAALRPYPVLGAFAFSRNQKQSINSLTSRMTSPDSVGGERDENLAARVDSALRYDFEEVDGPSAPSLGLHEEFGEGPTSRREQTLEDCRIPNCKLRDEAEKLRRDRAGFDM